MTKLCPRGKAAAKRKFKVYPSAYANAYASKICAGKIKDPSGVKRKDFRGRKPAAVGGPIRKYRDYKKKKTPGLKMPRGPKMSPTPPTMTKEELKKGFKARTKLRRSGMMGGGLMEATQRLKRQGYRKGGGVCLRGMNRDAIGKNS
jgi:hypothetical protein